MTGARVSAGLTEADIESLAIDWFRFVTETGTGTFDLSYRP